MAARAVTLLLVVMAAASCGGSKLTAPLCATRAVGLSIGPLWSEKTGQETLEVDLTNRGSAACALKGFATLRAYDDAGVELPFRYQRKSDQMIVVRAPREVDLQPGGRGAFVLNKYRCDERAPGDMHVLAVTLPGSSTARLVAVPRAARGVEYCIQSPEVELTPILASARQATPAR